jgi:hypothetical protein
MTPQIRKHDEVWTADNIRLGVAHQLVHRTGDINPQLQLYATYLRVKNFELGQGYYVPTDFIAGRDPATGQIRLTLPFKTVTARTWTRMPQFVLSGLARMEELPEREAAAVEPDR